MEDYKSQLVRLKTRLVSAWEMVDYDKAKWRTDTVFTFYLSIVVLTLMKIFVNFPKISNPYAKELYVTAVMAGYLIFFHTMVFCCRVLRFLRCLISGGGCIFSATDPNCFDPEQPLINRNLLV